MGKVGTEATLLEILGEVRSIATDTDIIASGSTAGDWAGVKKIVQHGFGARRLPIGTQLVDTFTKTAGGAALDNPWDVVHHYENGDMALNMHFAFPDGMPFDAPEAIYYAPDGGLAAGQYYITIGMAYGNGWKAGHHINFTLTDAMEAGDQLVISTATDPNTDPTAGRAWNVYAKGSTTSKQNGVTSDSTEGTELGSTSTSGVGFKNGNINAPQVVVYGYGRWSQSAIRQYLNSAAAAGAWWTPQNPWDRPPAQAATVRGFLACCSPEFVAALDEVEVVTAINTVEGSTEVTETTMDKIFLPSKTQLYMVEQYAEDEPWDYFEQLAVEAGLSGRFQDHPTVYEVIKRYNLESQSSAGYAWLRSSNRPYATNAWYVSPGGTVIYGLGAYNAIRGCPACKFKKSTPAESGD